MKILRHVVPTPSPVRVNGKDIQQISSSIVGQTVFVRLAGGVGFSVGKQLSENADFGLISSKAQAFSNAHLIAWKQFKDLSFDGPFRVNIVLGFLFICFSFETYMRVYTHMPFFLIIFSLFVSCSIYNVPNHHSGILSLLVLSFSTSIRKF